MESSIRIRNDLRPGDVGNIVKFHGEYYSLTNGFDISFEPYVAIPLAKLVLRKDKRERIWIAENGNEFIGCIAIAKLKSKTAQLRWYIIKDNYRGKGIGRDLINKAIEFAVEMKYSKIILWTVSDQKAAINVYKKNGFTLKIEKRHRIWGKELSEQCYEKRL